MEKETVVDLTSPDGSKGPYPTTSNAKFYAESGTDEEKDEAKQGRVDVKIEDNKLIISGRTKNTGSSEMLTATRALDGDITSPQFEGRLVIRRQLVGLGGPDGLGKDFKSVDAEARKQIILTRDEVRSLSSKGELQDYLRMVANTPYNERLPTVKQFREQKETRAASATNLQDDTISRMVAKLREEGKTYDSPSSTTPQVAASSRTPTPTGIAAGQGKGRTEGLT